MKIGDKIFCLDYQICSDYNDDIKYKGGLLKNNTEYTIYGIFLEFSDYSDKWVTETPKINDNNCQIYFELIELDYLMFNKCRFLTSNEYRKLKLKKLNESR